jgi:hypothetical protein
MPQPSKKKQKFPLSKLEWAALSGLSLFLILAISSKLYPSVFGGSADILVYTIGVAAVGAAAIYYVLWPLICLLLAALWLCWLAFVFVFRAFIAILNFMGAAWRGEIRP